MSGIEVNLRCGDTITVQSMPAIGAYRYCIHCDGRRQVIGVPVTGSTERHQPTLSELQAIRDRIGQQYMFSGMPEPQWQWQNALCNAMIDRVVYYGRALTERW